MDNPRLATRYAERAHEFFTAQESAPWELAFAEAVLAHAAAISGRPEDHQGHYAQAAAIAETLEDEDLTIFRATFDLVPVPPEDAGSL